jgi:hypothetical protein
LNQNLAVIYIRARITHPRWWKREPYLDLATVGPDFLRELMETYYSTASFNFGYQYNMTHVDFNFWSLLAADTFGTTCVPAKHIKMITIDVALEKGLNHQQCRLLEPPVNAASIEGAICCVVFKADYMSSRRCRAGFTGGMMSKPARLGHDELLRRMDRSITRMTAMGIDVQVFNRGKLIYPSNWREEAIEMKKRLQVNGPICLFVYYLTML